MSEIARRSTPFLHSINSGLIYVSDPHTLVSLNPNARCFLRDFFIGIYSGMLYEHFVKNGDGNRQIDRSDILRSVGVWVTKSHEKQRHFRPKSRRTYGDTSEETLTSAKSIGRRFLWSEFGAARLWCTSILSRIRRITSLINDLKVLSEWIEINTWFQLN